MSTSWISTSPSSGSGNGTVQVGAIAAHTGRVARTGTLQVVGTGVASPTTVTATQSAKSEFVSWDDGASASAPQAGGNVTLTGLTNSKKLTFSWVGNAVDGDGNESDPETGINYPEITLPTTYSADGVTVNNGSNIPDDPGSISQIPFSITLNFPQNTSTEAIHRTLLVTADGGQTAQIETIQSAGSAYITVTPTEITIPADGTPVSITIQSNTT